MVHDLLHNSGVWVLFSFLIFVGVAWKMGRHSVLRSLDERIEAIRREIDSAKALRAQAETLVAQYERKHSECLAESKAIVDRAHEHADRIRHREGALLAQTLAQREEALAERIRRMEDAAVQEIRDHASRLSVLATSRILAERVDEKAGQTLADHSVGDIVCHLVH
jgi:F-type H+-transporting ATPase subunit b